MEQNAVISTKRKMFSAGQSSALAISVDVAVLTVLGTVVAMASTAGGPFSQISNFVSTNFLPAIGSVGVMGGIGYGAIHAFRHKYGEAIVGLGVATAGGFVVGNSSWFSSQAGVSAATIGSHLPVLHSVLHALGV